MKDSIKALREKHNYSQSYLATYLQVSRQMYIKYESGEVEPPVKVVVALAKLYSVSYSQIIDDEFSPNKEKVSYKKLSFYNLIDNNFEIPLSSIVSPYIVLAASIEPFL